MSDDLISYELGPGGSPGDVPVRNVIGEVLSRAARDQIAVLAPPAYSPFRNHVAVMRDKQVIGYDMVLPKWPDSPPWTPLRDRIPRASRYYRADAGFMVHVKPDCRCR